MKNKNTQTDVTNVMLRDYEEEINRQAQAMLDVLCQRLLKYTKETVGSFLESITRDYEKRVKENKKLRDEIECIRLKLLETEKCLLQSCSIHQTSPTMLYPTQREFYMDAPEERLNQRQ